MEGRTKIAVTSCPFCGATTDLPHHSQEACIAALQEEIALTRKIVDRVKSHAHSNSGDDQNTEKPEDRKR
jgi:uncharacterized Zn finger protein (UPF0148 family)